MLIDIVKIYGFSIKNLVELRNPRVTLNVHGLYLKLGRVVGVVFTLKFHSRLKANPNQIYIWSKPV